MLDENGKIEPTKVNALIFDQFKLGYYTVGEKVGQAWNAGKEWMKKWWIIWKAGLSEGTVYGNHKNRFHARHAVPKDAMVGQAQTGSQGHSVLYPGEAGRGKWVRWPRDGNVRRLRGNDCLPPRHTDPGQKSDGRKDGGASGEGDSGDLWGGVYLLQ